MTMYKPFWLILEVLSFSISPNAYGISLCFNTYFLHRKDALFSYTSSHVLKIDFPGVSPFTACLSAVLDFVLFGISSTLSAPPCFFTGRHEPALQHISLT